MNNLTQHELAAECARAYRVVSARQSAIITEWGMDPDDGMLGVMMPLADEARHTLDLPLLLAYEKYLSEDNTFHAINTVIAALNNDDEYNRESTKAAIHESLTSEHFAAYFKVMDSDLFTISNPVPKAVEKYAVQHPGDVDLLLAVVRSGVRDPEAIIATVQSSGSDSS